MFWVVGREEGREARAACPRPRHKDKGEEARRKNKQGKKHPHSLSNSASLSTWTTPHCNSPKIQGGTGALLFVCRLGRRCSETAPTKADSKNNLPRLGLSNHQLCLNHIPISRKISISSQKSYFLVSSPCFYFANFVPAKSQPNFCHLPPQSTTHTHTHQKAKSPSTDQHHNQSFLLRFHLLLNPIYLSTTPLPNAISLSCLAVTCTPAPSPNSVNTAWAAEKSCPLVEGVEVMMHGIWALSAAWRPMRLSSMTTEREVGMPSLWEKGERVGVVVMGGEGGRGGSV